MREKLGKSWRVKTDRRHSSSILNQWDYLGHSFAFLQPGSNLVQINICWCIISWSRFVFSIARLSFNKMTKHDFIRQTNEIKSSRRLLEMFLFFFFFFFVTPTQTFQWNGLTVLCVPSCLAWQWGMEFGPVLSEFRPTMTCWSHFLKIKTDLKNF